MTMPRDEQAPKVGDSVLVAGNELEIRAIISQESSLILADATKGRRRPELWVLWHAELVPLAAHRWQATEYTSFDRAGEPAADK
jgi:hypothetical protein